MFDVLVFVYENYWCGDILSEPRQLERKLNAAGFESDEVHKAIDWLNGLNQLAEETAWPSPEQGAMRQGVTEVQANAQSLRIYSTLEQDQLGPDCLGFVMFLESAGVLPATLREVVIDRAMAVPTPTTLEHLKIIVLMVYWRFGEEPDALILDELCDDAQDRVAH